MDDVRRIGLVGLLLLTLVGCGGPSEPGAQQPAASVPPSATATPAFTVPGPTSDAAVAAFAEWYRAAVEEGGGTVPARLAKDNPASEGAMRGFIRILCPVNAPDTPRRHAAAEIIKNDPEFFGDASFAASAIVQARITCGLEK